MSIRLNQLAARVVAISDASTSRTVLMLRAVATVLAKVFEQPDASLEDKQKNMESAWNVTVPLSQELGENHEAIRLVRAMHKLAKAILEGKPEPTDEELGIASKCFVATACYGDYDAPEVLILRHFRDETLLKSPYGCSAVDLYYRLSPPLARWLERHNLMAGAIRKLLLTPITKLVGRGQQ